MTTDAPTSRYEPGDLIRKGARVGFYKRISQDDEDDAHGVQNQDEDGNVYIASRGWTVDKKHVFCDNDVSASTLSNKPRKDYDRLIAAVRAGEIDVVVARDNSRLTRRPLELEALIQLHEETGILISTWRSGTDDLSTADGRMVARIKASIDAGMAEKTRENTKRQLKRRRAEGKPHNGQDRFGYIYVDKATGYVVDEDLRPVVVELYRRWIATGALPLLAIWLNNQGITTTTGGRWEPTSLRHVLDTGFAAGLVRQRSRPSKSTKLESFDKWPVGIHEPIIDIDTWNTYKAKRLSNNKTHPRRVASNRTFSGLLACGWCDSLAYLGAAVSRGTPTWRCSRYETRAHAYVEVKDQPIKDSILGWLEGHALGGDDVDSRAARLARAQEAQSALILAKAELERITEKSTRLTDRYMEDKIPEDDYERLRVEYDQEKTRAAGVVAKAREREALARPEQLAKFRTLREEWNRLEPSDLREALREVLLYVIVTPVKGGLPELRFIER